MGGSHWIATYVRDNVINYFDSFGLPPFQEIVDHAKRKNLTLLHQNQANTKSLYNYLWLFLLVFFK